MNLRPRMGEMYRMRNRLGSALSLEPVDVCTTYQTDLFKLSVWHDPCRRESY